MKMACCITKLKLTKKQLLHILIHLSGTAILIWQIWHTCQAFIEGQTTFSVTRKTHESIEAPAMLLCPSPDEVLSKGNISDKNWYNKQFFWLNDSLKLTLFHYKWYNESIADVKLIDLNLGKNSGINVEEVMHPYIGLCYALTFDDKYRMRLFEAFILKAEFDQGKKAPQVEISILHPDDRYGILYLEGSKEPYKYIPEPEAYNELWIEKSVWKYLSSGDANCKYYRSKEETYQTCKLKMHVDCFRSEAPKRGCNCIPEHAFITHFEMYPIDRNACKTDEEFMDCKKVLDACAWEKSIKDGCPLPCDNVVFSGKNRLMKGIMTRKKAARIPGFDLTPNKIVIGICFSSMNVNHYNEVLMQEVYDFIGTVGGSLGLFIGFSFTGFVGQILDRFVRND